MPPLLASTVQSRPFAVPIERYTIRALVQLIQLLQIVVFDSTRSIYIEKSKGDLVLCVWFRKEVFERAPVEEVEFSCLSPICDPEQNCILFTFDLVL